MCAVQVGPGIYAFEPGDVRPEALLFEYTVESSDGSADGEAYYCICSNVSEVAGTCADILRAQLEAGITEEESYADYLRSGAYANANADVPAPPDRNPDAALIDRWIAWQSERLMGLHLTYLRSQSPAILAGVVEIIRQYNFGEVSFIEALGSYVDDSQEYLLDRLAAMRAARGGAADKRKLALPADAALLAELFTFLNERN